ncbi:MAG: A24 family peptidase [Amphiplicatus sp.]
MCALINLKGKPIFSEWVFFATAALVGLLIGGFLNVVIYRGPAMWGLVGEDKRARGDLIAPRSYCPNCKTPIARAHLAPLVGYLVVRGQCASCGAQIPIRYPLVELLGAGAALGACLLFGFTLSALFAAIFFWCLIALAVIDFETGYLPDAIVLPLIAAGLIVNIGDRFVFFADAAIGAVAGYLVFTLIRLAYAAARGREGLGQGDAKLLAAIGAWVGWQGLPAAIFIAAAGSLVIIMAVRLGGRRFQAGTALPFGPGLCFGAAAVLAASRIDLTRFADALIGG